MSPSHPRRSRRSNAAGYVPRPAEVAQIREEMEMTQTEFAAHVLVNLRTVQKWEGGERNMPALTWEYVCLMQAYPEVERARRLWREGYADVPVAS